MQNPKAALAAFNAPMSVKVGPYAVREITLSLGGILEQIGSPIFTGAKPKSVLAWVPTLYAMTHTTEENGRALSAGVDAFNTTAAAWADTVPYGLTRKLIDAVNDSVRRLNAISGDEGEDDEEGSAEKNASAAGPMGG